jgi:GH15 family glucan-1,4-alpha-glucosidase
MKSIYENSLRLILNNQSQEGAFIACPNFEVYKNAWFRDGSFCSYALTRAGYVRNAFLFHQWASQIVLRYEEKILKCIEGAKNGTPPPAELCFHSRFNPNGNEVPGNWGHHQLDGLGTWIWALGEFQRSDPRQTLPDDWRKAAALIKDYLSIMWSFPCSDCWEENETRVHTYTLVAVFAGLENYSELFVDRAAKTVADQVRAFIFENCVHDGSFIKSVGMPEVDSNLIGLVIPYHLVEWDDPIFQKTLMRIQKDLITPIGVHRYLKDTYYGGGEWVLLTAWLGWATAQAGDLEKARCMLEWTEAQASPTGELAEQVAHGLFDKANYEFWHKKWGPIASPLLWSHAMYILLVQSIKDIKSRS